MNKKNILYVFSGEYPWEIRILKQIETLRKDNYKISMVVRNLSDAPSQEILDGIKIIRVGNILKNSKLDTLLSLPIFLNPLWVFKILMSIIIEKPQIIIIREIPLAPIVLFFAKVLNIKVILDVAEHFPALMKMSKKYNANKFFKFIISNLHYYDAVEKISVKYSDKILTVIEESQNRLIESYKQDESKFFVVSNTPTNVPEPIEKSFENHSLNVVYTGNVDGYFRGLRTLLSAAEILKNNHNIIFNIVGSGSELTSLIEFKEENNLDNVNFLGRYSHNDLLEFLKSQDIGIVPHEKTDEIEYTIPNKLFDYMSYSLPVLVSSAKPLQRITNESNCGYVFEAGNPESLASILLNISNNKNELYEKSKNGYNAIIKKYNWSNDGNIFYNVVSGLISK